MGHNVGDRTGPLSTSTTRAVSASSAAATPPCTTTSTPVQRLPHLYNDFHTWLGDVKGGNIRRSRKYDLIPRFSNGRDPPATRQLHYQISPDAEYRFRHNGHNIRANEVIVPSKRECDENGEGITTLTAYGRSHDVLKAPPPRMCSPTGRSRDRE